MHRPISNCLCQNHCHDERNDVGNDNVSCSINDHQMDYHNVCNNGSCHKLNSQKVHQPIIISDDRKEMTLVCIILMPELLPELVEKPIASDRMAPVEIPTI